MFYFQKKKPKKIKALQHLLIFTLTIIIIFSGTLTQSYARNLPNFLKPRIIQDLPLSTRGAKIVNARGETVLLRGVNWFGMETETHAPHGLWKRDYKQMLAQIKMLGYNFIRLPFSVAGLRSNDISGVDFSIGNNKDLEGKTSLEVMDLVIQEAERQGLLILLDCHRLNDQRIPELWYGDGFTEADWIDTWKMLAERYKNQANVIGADLKNEPHGKASWGTGDLATDWRLAAERSGNAILAINPNWLIVVEGVENNVPGQKLKIHWQGGNLEGVKDYPVRLSRRNKLVYSPHEYGPGVYNQPYFSDKNFPKNLINRWQIGFNYIASQNIAPVLIGEFGGKQVDTKSTEGIWQNELVKYIKKQKLSFAYWSWNPNSPDTAGILIDDWQSIDVPKQQLLSQLLPVKLTPTLIAQMNRQMIDVRSSLLNFRKPEDKIVPLPPPLSLPVATASTQLQVKTDIYSDWETGFCVTFKISNRGNSEIRNWQLSFDMKQAAINNSWNANFIKQKDDKYIATPLDWGRIIERNQVRDIGFCANKLGSDYQPKQVKFEVRRT